MHNMDYRQPMGLQTPEQKQMGMFLHLSQLLNVMIPIAGIIVPIVLWQTQKDKMPGIARTAKWS